MTNQQGAPEALRPIARYKIGYHTDGWGMRDSTPSGIPDDAGAWVRYEDHLAALVDAQQPATHVQKQPKIEHVAGDVSQNWAESNMSTQPARSQQETQEPVAWYVTGCERLLGEDDAKAEARHIGGTARAMPLYTAPQPAPTPQADSQPALDRTRIREIFMAHGFTVKEGQTDLKQYVYDAADALLRAARAPADSVLEDAGGANWQDISTAPKDGTRFVAVGNNYGLYSETQHTCIAQWFRGCWMETSDWNETSELKYLTHWMPLLPLPGSAARATADSVLEDAARYRYLRDVPMAEWPDELATAFRMQQNAIWDAAIDAARKQGVKP